MTRKRRLSVDLAPGTKINFLTVLRFAYRGGPNENGAKYFTCRCDCGREKDVKATRLTPDGTKSCGQHGCRFHRRTRKAGFRPTPTLLDEWRRENARHLRTLETLAATFPPTDPGAALLAATLEARQIATLAATALTPDPTPDLYDDL